MVLHSHQVLHDGGEQNPETGRQPVGLWRQDSAATKDGAGISPRLLDGEAVHSQDAAQFVVGAVDDVLLLLVVQLLLDDVLAQVEHHLWGTASQLHDGRLRGAADARRERDGRGPTVPPSW